MGTKRLALLLFALVVAVLTPAVVTAIDECQWTSCYLKCQANCAAAYNACSDQAGAWCTDPHTGQFDPECYDLYHDTFCLPNVWLCEDDCEYKCCWVYQTE